MQDHFLAVSGGHSINNFHNSVFDSMNQIIMKQSSPPRAVYMLTVQLAVALIGAAFEVVRAHSAAVQGEACRIRIERYSVYLPPAAWVVFHVQGITQKETEGRREDEGRRLASDVAHVFLSLQHQSQKNSSRDIVRVTPVSCGVKGGSAADGPQHTLFRHTKRESACDGHRDHDNVALCLMRSTFCFMSCVVARMLAPSGNFARRDLQTRVFCEPVCSTGG